MSKPEQHQVPTYPLTDRNRLRRRPERAHYDVATVYGILDAALICHIAFYIHKQPYCTTTAFWRKGEFLFWHGSSMGRMLRSQSSGMNVCLTVTHLDALVLARSAFEHSINYRSVTIFGKAALIKDSQQKLKALSAFIDRFYPGRSQIIRPPTEQELQATAVATMHIDQAAAKIRDLPPHEQREEEYGRDIWAGLIPIVTHIGAPISCTRLSRGITMGNDLSAYREGHALDSVLSSLAQRSTP